MRHILRIVMSMLLVGTVSAQGANNAAGSEALGMVDISFCNEAGSTGDQSTADYAKLSMQQGIPADLCIQLTNRSDKAISIKLTAVDGTVTSDVTRKRSCKGNKFTDRFGQYVEGYDKLVTVPAGATIKQQATIDYPTSHVGTVLGCIAYEVFKKTDKEEEGGMFDIILRKAKFVDTFVDGELEVGLDLVAPETLEMERNIIQDEMIYVYETPEGKIAIDLGLHNIGHIAQDVTINASMSNMMGKELWNGSELKTITPDEKSRIHFVVPSLPWYKGRFILKLEVGHQPDLEGLEEDVITEEMKKNHVIDLSYSFFLFPWWIFAVLCVIVIIVQLIRHKRKKKKDGGDQSDYQQYNNYSNQQYSPYQGYTTDYNNQGQYGQYNNNTYQYPPGYGQ